MRRRARVVVGMMQLFGIATGNCIHACGRAIARNGMPARRRCPCNASDSAGNKKAYLLLLLMRWPSRWHADPCLRLWRRQGVRPVDAYLHFLCLLYILHVRYDE